MAALVSNMSTLSSHLTSPQEDLTETLCDSAWKLIQDYSLSMKNIFHMIRKKVEEKTKDLPPTPVLYNGCYGGYEVSDHYLEFI